MSGWGLQTPKGLSTRYLLHGNVSIVSNGDCAKSKNYMLLSF